MKQFIRLSDGALVTEQDIDPLMVYPSDNFKPSLDLYAPVVDVPPPSIEATEAVEEGPPAQVDGAWRRTWVKRQARQDELDARRQAKAQEVRARRDRLLADSDWTQLLDTPQATQAAWATYRQAVRDVTKQPSFPFGIEWPVKP